MKRLEYIFFRLFCSIVGSISFRWIYILSDILSFIAQYIVQYRKKTVIQNLRQSFPEKSEREIKKITREFYRNLCDVALESIKGLSLNGYQLKDRYKCLNPEIANNYFKEYQSIIFALSHYANWEWGTRVANIFFMHNVISFYKPLSNEYIDEYIQKQRAIMGMELCSIYQTNYIFRNSDNAPNAYFLISDQNPSKVKKAYWLKFLNQDTACIRGIESNAKLFNLPVIYADVQRANRGYYTISLEVICNNPKETQLCEITEKYMRKLEDIIISKPEDWLWSHKRWKVKKPSAVMQLS